MTKLKLLSAALIAADAALTPSAFQVPQEYYKWYAGEYFLYRVSRSHPAPQLVTRGEPEYGIPRAIAEGLASNLRSLSSLFYAISRSFQSDAAGTVSYAQLSERAGADQVNGKRDCAADQRESQEAGKAEELPALFHSGQIETIEHRGSHTRGEYFRFRLPQG